MRLIIFFCFVTHLNSERITWNTASMLNFSPLFAVNSTGVVKSRWSTSKGRTYGELLRSRHLFFIFITQFSCFLTCPASKVCLPSMFYTQFPVFPRAPSPPGVVFCAPSSLRYVRERAKRRESDIERCAKVCVSLGVPYKLQQLVQWGRSKELLFSLFLSSRGFE